MGARDTPGKRVASRPRMPRSLIRGAGGLQAVDEVRRALRVARRGKDRAAVCLEYIQPGGDVGGVVLTRLKRQIKIGTEEGGAKFRHEFFDRVAFGPETRGAEVARQARFVCGPVRLMPTSALDAECRLSNNAAPVAGFLELEGIPARAARHYQRDSRKWMTASPGQSLPSATAAGQLSSPRPPTRLDFESFEVAVPRLAFDALTRGR